MGYSPYAEAGKKVNGKDWKATIVGLPQINTAIHEILESDTPTAPEIEEQLRKVHALFAPHLTNVELTFSQREALQWFEDESPEYEIQEDTLHEWRENYDHYLGVLYDFADYNRIWVKPI